MYPVSLHFSFILSESSSFSFKEPRTNKIVGSHKDDAEKQLIFDVEYFLCYGDTINFFYFRRSTNNVSRKYFHIFVYKKRVGQASLKQHFRIARTIFKIQKKNRNHFLFPPLNFSFRFSFRFYL